MKKAGEGPHPDLDGIEVTPLPVGEGPGVRAYYQWSKEEEKGMIDQQEIVKIQYP